MKKEASLTSEVFAPRSECRHPSSSGQILVCFLGQAFPPASDASAGRCIAIGMASAGDGKFVERSAWIQNGKLMSGKHSVPSDDKSRPLTDAEIGGEHRSSAARELLRSECTVEGEPLEAVWRQFGDQLRRRARTRLRQFGLTGQAESMDICNDVMADMTRRYGSQGVTPDDVLAYVFRAIDNQVLDTFRTLARQCRDFRRNEGTSVEEMIVPNRDVTPSQIALRREVLDRIRSMLDADDARAIDMMLENRDWNEIGESLGLKADTARMRVRRALDRVRRDIGFNTEDVDE